MVIWKILEAEGGGGGAGEGAVDPHENIGVANISFLPPPPHHPNNFDNLKNS